MEKSRKSKKELIEELKSLQKELAEPKIRDVKQREAEDKLKNTLKKLGADQDRLQSYIE